MESKPVCLRVFFLMMVTTITLMLAACGGNPPPARATTPEPAPPPMEEPPTAATPARPEPAPPTPDPRVVAEPIHFDFDRFAIRDDARSVLDRKLAQLRDHPGIRLRIAGHADERGSDEYNLALGHRRAMAARAYFTDRGVDASRFETVSFGEERPIDAGSNETAWARNRRAEFEQVTVTAGQ